MYAYTPETFPQKTFIDKKRMHHTQKSMIPAVPLETLSSPKKIIATHVINPLKTRVLNNNETHQDHPLTRIHYQIKRNSLNDMTLTIVQTTSFRILFFVKSSFSSEHYWIKRTSFST